MLVASATQGDSNKIRQRISFSSLDLSSDQKKTDGKAISCVKLCSSFSGVETMLKLNIARPSNIMEC